MIGTEDVYRVTQLIGRQGLPIFAHADCSVLVVHSNQQLLPAASGCPVTSSTPCAANM
jgi:hypothetical protein